MISTDNYKHSEITEKIISAFYKVYNTLGYGFLEKVYENAIFIELVAQGMRVEKQKRIKVFYENKEVGEYFADLAVNEFVIVELKAAENLCEEHEFQLINYLKATEIEVGLLLNFGKKPEVKRKVFSNKINQELNHKIENHI
ncbi:MAG: GxxExxY protein [Bacteroidia bacterium]